MNAGKLLVLQDVTHHFLQLDVGAYRELADTVAVFIRVRVLPELFFKLLVIAVHLGDAIALHLDCQRRLAQQSILRAQIIADHTIHHKRAVHLSRSSEDLASRQIAPLLTADNAARLQPLVIRIHVGTHLRAFIRSRRDHTRFAHDVEHLLAQAVYLKEIGAHAFEHDLLVDVDHMRMPHLAPVHHIRHLHARLQLIALHLDGEDAHIARLHIVDDFLRQHAQRTRRKLFQHISVVVQLPCLEFMHYARRDLLTRVISDDRHLLLRLDAQADVDRIVGAGRELGVELQRR